MVPVWYMIVGAVFFCSFCVVAGLEKDFLYVIYAVGFFSFWPICTVAGILYLLGRMIATDNFPIIFHNIGVLMRNTKSRFTGNEPEEYQELHDL